MMRPTLALFVLLLGACATRRPAVPSAVATAPANEAKANAMLRDSFLLSLMHRYPQYFDSLLKENERWHIQVVYTQIDRDADNRPQLTHHFFNAPSADYFYPASTVKMPVAFLSLQRLNELKLPGLDANTTMLTEAAAPGQTLTYNDPSMADGRPTIAGYIRKIFLASDNDAFNRLYEFLGQEYINATLHRMGYAEAQIVHRLNLIQTEAQNRLTNPVRFYSPAAQLLYAQPLAESRTAYHPEKILLGNGYYAGGKLVRQPFDFSRKNRFSLPDLHTVLQSVIFPETVPARQRFNLEPEDYAFLYRCMSMRPRESANPFYDSSYNDSYVKFLLFGGRDNPALQGVRSFNKPGDAYGFLTDVAYIIDPGNGVEFFLSATIACNSDGIFNDDRYDYENVGLPFLKNLGKVIYDYEKNREKKHRPDLSRFIIDYGKQ